MSAYFDWWDGRERRALLLDGDRLVVGSALDSDGMVAETSVSRVHAMLHQLNGWWLRPNDDVRLGRARFVFCGQPSGGDVFTEPATVREMTADLTVSENAVKLHLVNLTNRFAIAGAERRRSRLANAALDAGAVTLAELRDR